MIVMEDRITPQARREHFAKAVGWGLASFGCACVAAGFAGAAIGSGNHYWFRWATVFAAATVFCAHKCGGHLIETKKPLIGEIIYPDDRPVQDVPRLPQRPRVDKRV